MNIGRELTLKRPANGPGVRRGYVSHRDLPTLLTEVQRLSLAGELESAAGPEHDGDEWRVRVVLLTEPVPRKVRTVRDWALIASGSLLGAGVVAYLLVLLVKAVLATLVALLPWLIVGGIVLALLARPTINIVQSVVIKR